MKTLIWLPLLVLEAVKSRMLSYAPSSESVREIEANARNELRLLEYKAKRLISPR